MKNITYKKYNKKEMIDIIKNYGIVFVDTNLGDHYIIKKADLAYFIMLEAERTGHVAEMECSMPVIGDVISTFGCFLNKANPILRKEIIKRLVLLQTTDERPKNVKVFDLDIFCDMSDLEKGIENGEIINFDKLYKKYME